MNEIYYNPCDSDLSVESFLDLVQSVWPGEYSKCRTEKALTKTMNFTAWDGERLVGCARVLTDGYFFGTIPEILIRPSYQGSHIGTRLMELLWQHCPTSLFFGAQPGNELFFERLGFEKSMQSYVRKNHGMQIEGPDISHGGFL